MIAEVDVRCGDPRRCRLKADIITVARCHSCTDGAVDRLSVGWRKTWAQFTCSGKCAGIVCALQLRFHDKQAAGIDNERPEAEKDNHREREHDQSGARLPGSE